ncbi:MAG: HEPN domain-containing protein [Treponema sp.]|nr:HEPN domain-containing protein [Treponema sp.]
MKNENLVKSWIEFADMDANLAVFTFENMYPKPLELICYHCQQAAEKILKAMMLATTETSEIQKTHDLALLADFLAETIEIDDMIYNACSDLTPYGVKVRYPKEVLVDEPMTKKKL